MTIILDCNIWVTLAINNQLSLILKLLDRGFELVSCETLRIEIADVISRPKLGKFIPPTDVIKIVQFHDVVTIHHEIHEILSVVRDPKDDYLLALCLKSNAAYLITGDKLLLEQKYYQNTEIISLATLRSL